MEAHPRGAALFFGAGDGDIDDADVDEAAPLQPADQGGGAGQEPDVAHFGVAVFGQ